MTLTDFLLARIAEDEMRARLAARQDWMDRRLLAECEAKRRIVGRHDVVDAAGGCAFCGEPAPCEHLRILASVYADHRDYDERWRP